MGNHNISYGHWFLPNHKKTLPILGNKGEEEQRIPDLDGVIKTGTSGEINR